MLLFRLGNMKIAKIFIFVLLVFNANAQKIDTLIIANFKTRIGVFREDSVWNVSNPIKLPSQPTYLTIKVIDKQDSLNQNLICIIAEEIKIYDTLYIGKNPEINLFNLSGGNYRLRFINLTNKNTTNIKFSIEPSFYEKWWFNPMVLLVLTSIIGFIFYILYSVRLRQQLRTQIIRDSIARDLHDDIGSYLSSISILSKNVENLIYKNPEKAQQSLTKIGETARQVMDTMGDIVWSINPKHDSMEEVISRMKDFSTELFFNQETEIDFISGESLKKANLSLERRRDFFLIYKEAMTNIYKYASASHINISLQEADKRITMVVEDNGKGFELSKIPENRINRGNGLKNMQARTEKLGGKLEIISKINQGTKIQLVFEL